MTQQLPGMDPTDILSEIAAAAKRLKDGLIVDQKAEFLDNVYPLLKLITEMAGGRSNILLERVDGVELSIAEYLMGQESMILPELATTLHTALGLGIHLCDAIDRMFAETHAQIRKELGEAAPPEMFVIPKEIAVLLVAYRQTATDAAAMVSDVTAESIDDEEGEGDERDVVSEAKTDAPQEGSDD